MPHFDVYKPNGKKFRILFDAEQDKNELVSQTLLNSWDEYCDEHWLWQKKYDPFKLNFEDKTKNFLERCGTFLLLGNFGYGNIIKDLSTVYEMETSLIEENDECDRNTVDFDMLPSGKDVLWNTLPHHKQKTRIRKRHKESQSYKIDKLFSFSGKRTYQWYKLKNKDIAEAKCPVGEDVAKWNAKPFHNRHGDPVYEYRTKFIPARSGMIDPDKPYVSKWCYVWADNTFEYGGYVYTISPEVAGYKAQEINYENFFVMDKILVYEQADKLYFFDQSVNQINNSLIQEASR